ncbi:MAG: iron ABC transporter substrate-binding protein [Alphaproteobacteria bacterium]|nr:iron ABC transporter substrate-binding protein [Alphaproteobacteria bacterium]
MRNRLGGLVWGVVVWILCAGPAAAERVTDSAGRRVAVPDRVERVFAAGPPASIFLYVLAPDRLLGWNRPLRPAERPFIAPAYRDLPALGRLTGRGNTANVEVILRARPDLVFDFGSLRATYISLADRVQAQTGLPYLLIDGSLENTAASLRLLGSVLGAEARAERLARFAEETYRALDAGLAQVPETRRPRVYFARGPDGLETGVRGSINTEIIERVGAINVAVSESRRGLARVSIEQVLAWNPDTIVTLDEGFFAAVQRDPLWRQVEAVRRERVYLAPLVPFGWVDRPPSVNRLMGIRWLARLLYPEVFGGDLAAATREFYALFYQVDLTEDQLEQLLARAGGVR